MATITEKSKITIGLAIALVGGIVWLTSINNKADQALANDKVHEASIEAIRAKQESNQVVQYQMATDIAVIKTILERGKGK